MYDNLYFDNDIVRLAKEISEQYSDIFRQLSDISRFQNITVPKFCIEPKLVDHMGSYINNSISTKVAQIQSSYTELIKSRIVLPDLTRQIHELKSGIIVANHSHLQSMYSAISDCYKYDYSINLSQYYTNIYHVSEYDQAITLDPYREQENWESLLNRIHRAKEITRRYFLKILGLEYSAEISVLKSLIVKSVKAIRGPPQSFKKDFCNIFVQIFTSNIFQLVLEFMFPDICWDVVFIAIELLMFIHLFLIRYL